MIAMTSGEWCVVTIFVVFSYTVMAVLLVHKVWDHVGAKSGPSDEAWREPVGYRRAVEEEAPGVQSILAVEPDVDELNLVRVTREDMVQPEHMIDPEVVDDN